MSAEDWIPVLEAGVVSLLLSETDLVGLCGKIEIGLTMPLKTQEITQRNRPYLGVKYMAHSGNLKGVPGCASHHSVHDVSIRIDIQHAKNPQIECEAMVKRIISQLSVSIGSQAVSNPFAVRSGNMITIELEPGAGAISMVKEPSEDDGEDWIVEGEYVFQVRIRLKSKATP